MTTSPLVTVIAVCYNHSQFVIECLDSIRAQSYPHTQIIIMDDCSQDDSVALIKHWIKEHAIECELIAHRENQGLCRTLNEALELAQGEFISLIATDDTWLPNKITQQVTLMESMPKSIGVIYSDAYQIDEDGNRLPKMFIEEHRAPPLPLEGDLLEPLIYGNFIPAMSTLVRSDVYRKIGCYDENLIYEDWDFWLRAAKHFLFAYAPSPSANYRIVATSMTRTLFLEGNNELSHTNFEINKKILATPNISQAARVLVTSRLARTAHHLYATNHRAAPQALATLFKATKRFSDLYITMFAFLGISHSKYRRTVSYLQWRIARLKLLKISKRKKRE